MSRSSIVFRPATLLQAADPRRSQAAGALWLIIALSAIFSIVAAWWVGGIARDSVLQQHTRRLALEADQLASNVSQAIAARLGAVRAAQQLPVGAEHIDRRGRLTAIYGELVHAYPELGWLFIADSTGNVITSAHFHQVGDTVAAQPWFAAALRAPVLIAIERRKVVQAGIPSSESLTLSDFGDFAAPLKDADGQVIGVIGSHLQWQRSPHPIPRLTDETASGGLTQAAILDAHSMVIAGPPALRDKRWPGIAISSAHSTSNEPSFERLPDGRQVLVARAQLSPGTGFTATYFVQLIEPNARVYQRADALARQILRVSISLGALTSLLGALGARHLTGRLKRLALSVAAVERNEAAQIDVPSGRDEVARLASAFSNVLEELHSERSELQTLGRELERRVAVRTGEVERLAEEARYAAIVRERLKLARDLHDTLAHSMMAMLSEIRFLRRLQLHDPTAMAEELARAEEVAHAGLHEVRAAITQMRESTVRDTGLGAALNLVFQQFIDRSGLTGEFHTDAAAARFGDDRAETLLRMIQEVLRNTQAHAMANRVDLSATVTSDGRLTLRFEDDGVGFNPAEQPAGHYGIPGLYEQAVLIGASVEIDSQPLAGTRICIAVHVSPIAFATMA